MLKNILSLITGSKWDLILVAMAVSFIGGGFLGWHERVLREPDMINQQIAADKAVCDKNKKTTKEANDALQNKRYADAKRIAALKLQQPTRCVPVAGEAKLSDSGREHDRPHGLSSDWLYDFAATGEGYRSALEVCEKFIDDERANRP